MIVGAPCSALAELRHVCEPNSANASQGGVMTEFRLGLRVEDVPAAIAFYGGLGFEQEGRVPNAEGEPVMAILRRGTATVVVEALIGLPFPDTERERSVQAGPRGLGMVIGLGVDDLDATYDYCTQAGCEITCEPMDEAWGERLFTCVDPFGYEWEFVVPIPGHGAAEGTEAVRERWFGS
jgi:uncharacterized glyoxalase superfamily protein PhnB